MIRKDATNYGVHLHLLITSLFLIPLFSFTQELPVTDIPASLTENADAVKRMEEIRFEMISPVNTVLKRRYAVTVLNENGAKHAHIALPYSNLSAIKSISGILYDASGKEIRRIRSRDFADQSAVGGSNLIDDHRIKSYNVLHRSYPYTILYEYEEYNNNSLFLKNWIPVEGDRFAVQQSRFSMVYPAAQLIRFKAFNYGDDPVKQTEKNKDMLIWEIKNYPAIERQPMAPVFHELVPAVFTGPVLFEIEGYKGDMSSWESFGKFVASLAAGRDVLPEKVKQEVHQLTSGLTSDWEKTDALYQYLQRNTRYISIQLGIGGWQPFDAAYVAANAYGDCKALTNYMYSLLKEAGITSYYTLVRAGNNARPVMEDMPSQQFNHVILAVVPDNADTIWLECTSQSLPTGYLSSFTANRHALLVSGKGGKLVRTPHYGVNENQRTRRIQAVLNEEGQLDMRVNTIYTGQQQDPLHQMIHHLSAEKMKERLNRTFDLATYEIHSFKHTQHGGRIPRIEENLQAAVKHYATTTGKRLFIQPDILSKNYLRLPDERRRFDIEVPPPYLNTDTVEIRIPSGYRVESMPDDQELNSDFGSYTAQFTLLDDTILYYRRLLHRSGRHPVDAYTKLRSFYEDIYRADRSRIVLVKE